MSELLAEEGALEARPSMAVGRVTGAAAALAAGVAALWGTNPAALKVAMREVPPIGAAGERFAIAAVGVYLVCRATGVRAWPRRGEGWWLGVVGLFFIAQIATFTLGVYWGSASHSVVLLHTYPFFVVGMAHFLIPGERATAGRAAGLAAAFGGIAALFAGEWGRWEGTQLLGDGVQLASALVLGAEVIFLKHAVARIDSTRVVLWQMVAGAAAFLGYSLAFEGLAAVRPGVMSAAAVVYQGLIIGTLCFSVWTWLLRRFAAGRVAVFGFISPLVGVAISVWLLREPVSGGLLVSAGMVALGIVAANVW